MQVSEAAAARVVLGQLTADNPVIESLTETELRLTLPLLVTR